MFLALTQDIPFDHVIPLPQYRNRVSIVNTGSFALISNICPHQNSRLVQGISQEIICPYHGLKFDCAGAGINNTMSLETWPVYQNQTILFDQHVTCTFPVDTQHMVLIEHRQDSVSASPDVVMDVFLDRDHIPVAHAGVYDQIGIRDIDNISFVTFENGSIQFAPSQEKNHCVSDDLEYDFGACWMAVYPGTMIEWQPGALFVTVAHSVSETSSQVQVYKYQDTRYSQQMWQLNQQVWECAWAQDRELAELIDSPAVDNLCELKQHYKIWKQDAE